MRRLYITGTDTDVGKTRVTGALARALREGGDHTTVVKLVQTGADAQEPGDAHVAAALARCDALECRRFAQPADPWTAARNAQEEPARAADLATTLHRIEGSLVVEGSGGAAVPLNEDESITDVAKIAGLETILVVGLRLGCINHARLTLEYLAHRDIPVLGMVLCENRALADPAYAGEVELVLRSSGTVLGTIPFETDAAASVRRAAGLFTFLRKS